jgi:hypothetical protein
MDHEIWETSHGYPGLIGAGDLLELLRVTALATNKNHFFTNIKIHLNTMITIDYHGFLEIFLVFGRICGNLKFGQAHASPCLGDASRPAFGRPESLE